MVLDTHLSIQQKWLITGVAGFIGSHLLERLLKQDQIVVGVDNFATGFRKNIDEALEDCTKQQRNNFTFYEGDIRDPHLCLKLLDGIDIVLHQAALASVPRSLEFPELVHDHNVNGMMSLLLAAKQHRPKAFIYASSSSVYGDSPTLPKKESHTGTLLSPYAASKHIMEVYADVFARSYTLNIIGIRYFNVFGPRQNKDGPYAAVIPTWMTAILEQKPAYMNGDGTTSRDFTYIQNVVDMNILAAKKAMITPGHKVYNAGAKQQTDLTTLYNMIVAAFPQYPAQKLTYRDFRAGDVKHSLADITLAETELNYRSTYSVAEGIQETAQWFKKQFSQAA